MGPMNDKLPSAPYYKRKKSKTCVVDFKRYNLKTYIQQFLISKNNCEQLFISRIIK
jgi:hypothetical protein